MEKNWKHVGYCYFFRHWSMNLHNVFVMHSVWPVTQVLLQRPITSTVQLTGFKFLPEQKNMVIQKAEYLFWANEQSHMDRWISFILNVSPLFATDYFFVNEFSERVNIFFERIALAFWMSFSCSNRYLLVYIFF